MSELYSIFEPLTVMGYSRETSDDLDQLVKNYKQKHAEIKVTISYLQQLQTYIQTIFSQHPPLIHLPSHLLPDLHHELAHDYNYSLLHHHQPTHN